MNSSLIIGVSAGPNPNSQDSNMATISGIVGAPSSVSIADGSYPVPLLGQQAEQVVTDLHGKYYYQNKRSNLYYASNAGAGATYSIFSNASYTGLALWNLSTTKYMSIVRVILGLNGAATTAEGAFGYAWLPAAGYAIGTAAPLSAVTEITATRGAGICGAPGQGSSVAKAYSAATLTTAMTWGRGAPFSSSTGAITTEIAVGGLVDEVDGTMIIPPGCFWTLTTAIATGGTFQGTVVWEEVPL